MNRLYIVTTLAQQKTLSNEFFVFNTNLTFLYNIDTEGFKKLPPVGFELTTVTITGLEFLLPYPRSQSASPWQSQIFRPLHCHALLILEMIQLQCKDFLFNRCLGG